MPLGGFKLTLFGGGSVSSTIRSLDYEHGSAQYLSMTSANYGSVDTKLWSLSFWYKRESAGVTHSFLEEIGSGVGIELKATDKIGVDLGSSVVTTTATYTDTTSFHHVYVIYDSAQATASDRIRLYYDGVRVTVFDGGGSFPTLNLATAFTTGTTVNVGGSGGITFDGLMYDMATFSATVPNVDDVYNLGTPPELGGFTGIHSHLNLGGSTTVEDDGVLATNWTNNNTVVASTTIPT